MLTIVVDVVPEKPAVLLVLILPVEVTEIADPVPAAVILKVTISKIPATEIVAPAFNEIAPLVVNVPLLAIVTLPIVEAVIVTALFTVTKVALEVGAEVAVIQVLLSCEDCHVLAVAQAADAVDLK